jgi:hypothetical protein
MNEPLTCLGIKPSHLICTHGSTSVPRDNEGRRAWWGIAAGRPMAEVIGAAAQSERGRWQLFDSVNLRNAELLYPLLEWE